MSVEDINVNITVEEVDVDGECDNPYCNNSSEALWYGVDVIDGLEAHVEFAEYCDERNLCVNSDWMNKVIEL